MTALDRYAKLEAVARYLDGFSPEAREVVLSFGERSLVIMELDDRPIAHWPLASLRALGRPAERPLELVPDPLSDERLLLDDAEMSTAIAEVCPRLHAAPAPRRRRRRRPALRATGAVALLGGAALAVLALGRALPESLVEMVPPAREEALGEAAAARVADLLGPGLPPGLCIGEEGAAALRALTARIVAGIGPAGGAADGPGRASEGGPAERLRVSVLDHPGVDAMVLPGGRVLLLRGLIDAARAPEEVAAVLAHAAGHALRREPLSAALERAGTGGVTAVLLGDVAGRALPGAAAAAALDRTYPPEAEAEADKATVAVLAAAGLPSRALAGFAARLAERPGEPPRWLARHPWTDERGRRARAADAVGEGPFRPALGDRDWIALGNICDRTAPARR